MPKPRVEAIARFLSSFPGIREAHLPQCFALGIMEAPAQVLVLCLARGSEARRLGEGIAAGLAAILPHAERLDVWPLEDGDPFLSSVRQAHCPLTAAGTPQGARPTARAAAGRPAPPPPPRAPAAPAEEKKKRNLPDDVAGLVEISPEEAVENFTRDLTARAARGEGARVVGRDREIEEMCEILCRSKKPNPLLVGRAGTGKTALVEGLAQRISRGEVPERLRGKRILSVSLNALIAGTALRGMFENRLQAILEYARSHAETILFLDEIHAAMGLGRSEGDAAGMANLMKPAIDRGEISVIGATTDEEYRKYLREDSAFERRFHLVNVLEMTPEATREVLASVAAHLTRESGVAIPEAILDETILLSRNCLRHRAFPDKAIDLLDQAVARTQLRGSWEAGLEEVRSVLYGMLGLPIREASEWERHLDGIGERLRARLPIAPEEAEEIGRHLRRTIPGLDIRSDRPNLVAGISGASEGPAAFARALAEAIFGDARRMILQELPKGGFLTLREESFRKIPSAFEKLEAAPSSVLLLAPERGAKEDPFVWTGVADALAAGCWKAADGRSVYLSDACVILDLSGMASQGRKVGFSNEGGNETAAELPEIDFSLRLDVPRGEEMRLYLARAVVPAIARAYEAKGILLEAAPSLLEEMCGWEGGLDPNAWLASFERRAGREIPHGRGARLRVGWRQGRAVVED